MTDMIDPKHLSAAARAAKVRARHRAAKQLHRGFFRNAVGAKTVPARAYARTDAGISRMHRTQGGRER